MMEYQVVSDIINVTEKTRDDILSFTVLLFYEKALHHFWSEKLCTVTHDFRKLFSLN